LLVDAGFLPGDMAGCSDGPEVASRLLWLDRSIPARRREVVAESTLEWSGAFERIGFRDAVVVQQQGDDDGFDTRDAGRASVCRHGVAEPAFAVDRSRGDPRSGEILAADIGMSDDVGRLPGISVDSSRCRTGSVAGLTPEDGYGERAPLSVPQIAAQLHGLVFDRPLDAGTARRRLELPPCLAADEQRGTITLAEIHGRLQGSVWSEPRPDARSTRCGARCSAAVGRGGPGCGAGQAPAGGGDGHAASGRGKE
jgi:hypothetical protein